MVLNSRSKTRLRLGAIASSVILVFGLAGTPAHANDGIDAQGLNGLSNAQKEAIGQLNTPITVSGRADVSTTSLGTSAAGEISPSATCATKSRAAKLYRGSFLMWGEDTFRFSYQSCKNKITTSSVSQRAGYVFPNIAKAKGKTKYFNSTSVHRWEGRYTIGAGVVTPWGDVRIYAADYTTRWEGKGSGSYSGRWLN